MAKWLEHHAPGAVRWEVCGTGPDLATLRADIEAASLRDVIAVRGWTTLDELRDVYTRSHAAIVPTRSDFAEGLAMTAAEAVLAGRPLITNPVVPALELLRPAAMCAITNDAISHARAVLELVQSPALYVAKQRACATVGAEFYDRSWGLRATLHRAVAGDGARSDL